MKEITNKFDNNLEIKQKLIELGFDIDNTWYHVTEKDFQDLDEKKFSDGNIWLTKNLKSILDGETGASLSNGEDCKILKCFIKSNIKIGGWDEEDSYFDEHLVAEGFDGLLLDDDLKLYSGKSVIVFDDNIDIKIKNLLTLQDAQKNKKKF